MAGPACRGGEAPPASCASLLFWEQGELQRASRCSPTLHVSVLGVPAALRPHASPPLTPVMLSLPPPADLCAAPLGTPATPGRQVSALREGEALPGEVGQPAAPRTWPLQPLSLGPCVQCDLPVADVVSCVQSPGAHSQPGRGAQSVPDTQVSGRSRRAGKKASFWRSVSGLPGSLASAL